VIHRLHTRNGGVLQDLCSVDQRHNILTLDTGTFRMNVTTNGLIHQNLVMSMRVRRVASILMMHRMRMLLVGLMWKDVVGGDEEVGYNHLLLHNCLFI
jgi:hypothetical protein